MNHQNEAGSLNVVREPPPIIDGPAPTPPAAPAAWSDRLGAIWDQVMTLQFWTLFAIGLGAFLVYAHGNLTGPQWVQIEGALGAVYAVVEAIIAHGNGTALQRHLAAKRAPQPADQPLSHVVMLW